nr:MAG TPA: hypothetical protein [Caudoviricetes sp.]
MRVSEKGENLGRTATACVSDPERVQRPDGH